MPTTYTAQQAQIERRRQMAQALIQSSMTPLEMPTMPGVGISPYAGWAKILQGIIGNRQTRKLDEAESALARRIQSDRERHAEEMAQAILPGQTMQMPMAPLMNMPAGDAMSPGSLSPNREQIAFPMALPARTEIPEGTRSLSLPVSTEQETRRRALTKALASMEPMEQQFGQTMMADIFAQEREKRAVATEQAQTAQQQGFQRELVDKQMAQAMELANRPRLATIPADQTYGPEDPRTGRFTPQGFTPGRTLAPRRPQTVTTEEGVFIVNPDGSKGNRLGTRPQPAQSNIFNTTPSVGMESSIRDALNRATMGTPSIRRAQVINTVNDMFARGDMDAVKSTIRQAAVESEPVAVRQQIQGRREVISTLSEIRDLLKDVPANLIIGTVEDTARKLGTTTDPRYVRIGNRLTVLNQSYRRSMTGAQFSIPESMEYRNIFPSYSNVIPVNTALIDSLMDALASNDRVYWTNKLGREWSDMAAPARPSDLDNEILRLLFQK